MSKVDDRDLSEDRKGQWMHVSLGGRFYPQDPRPEEIFISDIANGLAGERRYANQGIVKKHYSVAEHSIHMTKYAMNAGWSDEFCLTVLLHDAAEAYISDLAKSVKSMTGRGYKLLEKNLEEAIMQKYGVLDIWQDMYSDIKEIDVRMVPLEKEAIMRYPQPWAYDQYEPLEGVKIKCWRPETAKKRFLNLFEVLRQRTTDTLSIPEEYIEYD